MIGFQACYRGYKIRLVDPAGCLPAIRRLRAQLKKYRRDVASTTIQAAGRGVRARRKALVMSQIKLRNERDERVAAAIIQSILRALHARHEVIRLRLRRERLAALHDHAARVVTKFMKWAGGQSLMARLQAIMERKRRLQEGASLVMERCTRGLFGRQRARRRRKFMAMLNAQVTVIQKCYRGSRVMDWRNLRMNHIARHVYARRDFEQAQRALNRQKKFEAWQAELAKDSCSDSDGDAGGELGAEWVERRNLDGGLVWVHNETGEIVTVDPRTDPVDAELIGCSVRVFWPLEEQWFEGVLARFHRRRRKYRVEYIDGDHEWIDVDEAADRLQLYDASGSWSDFNVAVRPALAERQNKRAEKADIKVRARRLEEETRAWTVLPEKESDDEYDDDDDEAALERARAKMEVAKTGKRERWTNSLTGEIRFLSQDAAFWMESRDADKNFCSVAASFLSVASLASPVRSTPSTRAPSQASSMARPGSAFTMTLDLPKIPMCPTCAGGNWSVSTRCGPPFTLVLVSWKRGTRPPKVRVARRPAKRRSNACSRTRRRSCATSQAKCSERRNCGPRTTSRTTRNSFMRHIRCTA